MLQCKSLYDDRLVVFSKSVLSVGMYRANHSVATFCESKENWGFIASLQTTAHEWTFIGGTLDSDVSDVFFFFSAFVVMSSDDPLHKTENI